MVAKDILLSLVGLKIQVTPHEYLEAREVDAFSTTRLTAIHETGSRLCPRLLKQQCIIVQSVFGLSIREDCHQFHKLI